MREQAVGALVHFKVTVRSEDRGDHWMTIGLQTGIVTYGATREESEQVNGNAHIDAVRLVKKSGRAALEAFMERRQIDYDIDEEDRDSERPPFGPMLIPLAREHVIEERPIQAPEDREFKVAA